MSNELTNEEKANVLNNLIKNIKLTKYQVEQEILAEQNSSNPSQGWIDQASIQIKILVEKINYLENKLDNLL